MIKILILSTLASICFVSAYCVYIHTNHTLKQQKIGYYQSHRTYSVHDLSRHDLFPIEKWKIRNRKLKQKQSITQFNGRK